MTGKTAPRFRATFVDLGEGLGGDYNKDDPEDVSLLRVDIETFVDGEWTELHDGSYCTRIPCDTPAAEQDRLLAVVVAIMEEAAAKGASLKRTAERVSWIKPGDTAKDLPGD